MDSEHLSRLVDRYFRGETSLEEEATLRRILSQGEEQHDGADAFRTTPEARAASALEDRCGSIVAVEAYGTERESERGTRLYEVYGEVVFFVLRAALILDLGMRVHHYVGENSRRYLSLIHI